VPNTWRTLKPIHNTIQDCSWRLEQLMNPVVIKFMVSLWLQLKIWGRTIVSRSQTSHNLEWVNHHESLRSWLNNELASWELKWRQSTKNKKGNKGRRWLHTSPIIILPFTDLYEIFIPLPPPVCNLFLMFISICNWLLQLN